MMVYRVAPLNGIAFNDVGYYRGCDRVVIPDIWYLGVPTWSVSEATS